jgi:hypothetical protein
VPSPAELARLAKPDAKYIQAREEGRMEGRAQARKEILDYLEKLYQDPTIERGSAEGRAILDVAGKVSQHFTHVAGEKKKRKR